MTDEEILKAAQRDQSEIGEAEKEIIKKSFRYAIALATCICVIMILFELIIAKNIDFGKPAILFAFIGCSDFYEGKTNKKNKALISGILNLVISVLFVLLYIGATII